MYVCMYVVSSSSSIAVDDVFLFTYVIHIYIHFEPVSVVLSSGVNYRKLYDVKEYARYCKASALKMQSLSPANRRKPSLLQALIECYESSALSPHERINARKRGFTLVEQRNSIITSVFQGFLLTRTPKPDS